ncbi:MAG TPA: ATP-binding protein [bacterium]
MRFMIPNILVSAFFLLFGLFVFSKNKHSLTNIAFSIMCATISFWLFSYGISYGFVANEPLANFWLKCGYSAVILIPVVFYVLSITFLERQHFVKEKIIIFSSFLIAGIFIVLLWKSQLLVSGTYKYFWGYYPKGGALHPLFLFFYTLLCTRLIVLLYKTYRGSGGPMKEGERNKLRYMLLAFLITLPGAVDFLPNYGIELYPVAFVFVIMFTALVAYAIVRHQLMDIEVLLKRTMVFAGLVGSVVAVVSLVAFVTQELLSQYVVIPRMLSNIVAAIIIAGVYGRLYRWLVNATDMYLFQKKYDYKQLLKTFTDEVMVVVDLDKLVQMTVDTLSETVRVESCSLFLLNKETRTYEAMSVRGFNGAELELSESEQLVAFLRRTHEPAGLDGNLGQVRFPKSIVDRMGELKARLVLPLNLHEDLIGVLCLGKKKSDEEFTQEDLDILLPLARTLAIAISNAQLFDELVKTQAEAAQKEKLAVIGTLSAGINHEICNPLGIVKAQCEAFLLDQEDGILIGKTAQEVLDRVTSIMRGALKQIERATAITQKLSNFAKPIKAPTAEPVSVPNEIEEVMFLVGHDLKLERVEVKQELQPELPKILVDRRQLQEVLFNLIRNAGQAITPPGTITIRAAQDNGSVRIDIVDTGSGIPQDKLGKIFDPFFTTKEPGKGTGLGLFIVRQIVERNKGRISVQSAVGQGTMFSLEFPSAEPAAVTA